MQEIQFRQQLAGLINSKERLLVAVSGGVDSIVLFHWLLNWCREETQQLAVVHVNHNWRLAAASEQAALATMCQQLEVPFYTTTWELPVKSEAAARAFRYQFFAEVMEAEGYEVLLTAHHGDDLAETVLQRLVRGSSLQGYAGILPQRSFATGRLVRPLLGFSKAELLREAQEKGWSYWEDDTNQQLDFTRNRLRQRVMPLLKEENPRFLQKIHTFSQKIQYADEILKEMAILDCQQVFQKKQGDLGIFLKLSTARQQNVLRAYLAEVVGDAIDQFTDQHVTEMLKALRSDKPQVQVTLPENLVLTKSYGSFALTIKQAAPASHIYQLQPFEAIFLSETEWLTLLPHTVSLELPPQVATWSGYELLLPQVALPLTVRHRKAGDQIQLPQGFHKKISRLFIDQKVPNAERDQTWLVADEKEQLLWVMPKVNSYLSIPQETDKILYRLHFRREERK